MPADLPIYVRLDPIAIDVGPVAIHWYGIMYLVAFVSFLWLAQRRAEHRRNSLPEDESFHRCHACNKTEADDRHLEFRVAEDDEEYCLPCLAAKKADSDAAS